VEFWRRRDPDLQSQENEFKTEFDERMERANDIFISDGIPGWLTDRGRIYILFGPPQERIISPQETDGRSQEIWYYGAFPVVFIDRNSTGQFKLVTYDLSSLRPFNLAYMHEFSREQEKAQQTIAGESEMFNFDLEVSAERLPSGQIEGTVRIFLPDADLWPRNHEWDTLTILDLLLEIHDAAGSVVWSFEQSYEIRREESSLFETPGKGWEQKIVFTLDRIDDQRGRRENRVYATLARRTGLAKLRKVKAFFVR
jgi:GWxTD domain-containing protein